MALVGAYLLFFIGKGITSLAGTQNTLSTFYDRGRRLNHTPIFHDGTFSWDTHLYLLFSGFTKPRGALGRVLDLAALAQSQVAACFTTWADCATSFVMRAALLLAQMTLPFGLSARPRNSLPITAQTLALHGGYCLLSTVGEHVHVRHHIRFSALLPMDFSTHRLGRTGFGHIHDITFSESQLHIYFFCTYSFLPRPGARILQTKQSPLQQLVEGYWE